MTQSGGRQIDYDLIPRNGTFAVRQIIGVDQKIISQTEFEQLMAKGEGVLRELDLANRKRLP